MKAKDAIKYLNQMPEEAELIWHDVVEGNDCEVVSFYYLPKDNKVYVSPLTKEQLNKSFGIVEQMNKE